MGCLISAHYLFIGEGKISLSHTPYSKVDTW